MIKTQKLYRKLWRDTQGAVLSTELVLLTSMTAAGILTVAGDVRDAMTAKVGGVVSSIQQIPGGQPDPLRRSRAADSTSMPCLVVLGSDN